MPEPRDKSTNDKLGSKFVNIWIGVNDIATEGTWVYDSTGLEVTYFNWGSGSSTMEPNGGNGENCVKHSFQDWTWFDVNCSRIYPVVCEFGS